MAKLYRRGGKAIGTSDDDGRRWYVQYFDHTGKRKAVSTGTTEFKAAKKIAERLEAEAALRRHRVIDPREEAIAAQLARPTPQGRPVNHAALVDHAHDGHVRASVPRSGGRHRFTSAGDDDEHRTDRAEGDRDR